MTPEQVKSLTYGCPVVVTLPGKEPRKGYFTADRGGGRIGVSLYDGAYLESALVAHVERVEEPNPRRR